MTDTGKVRRRRWPWVLAGVLALLIIGAATSGKSKSPATSHPATQAASHPAAQSAPRPSVPASEKEARAWINEHRVDAEHVAALIALVQITLHEAEKHEAGESSLDAVAQAAQGAHDQINEVRSDFASGETSGALEHAALEVFTAANELKNAMGAMVAYTGNPNPATLAHFTSQYTPAREEWDHGITTIWSLAHQHHPPTI